MLLNKLPPMTRVWRTPFLALVLLLMAVLAIPAGSARAQDREISIETFHQELDQYGRWFAHPTHGYVWSPDVGDDWRPYSRGQWVFTDEHGWYWQSEEPFGWAVFHYGRWFLDTDSGWVWVPGTEWGPAWVAWRHSDQQVGWAPLPPEAEWRGDHLNFSSRYYESPRYTAAWCFVPVALLTSAVIYRHISHPSRNASFVRQTTWVQSHRSVDRRVYNTGFDRSRYERITRRPVTPLRIVEAQRPQEYGRRSGLGRSNEIRVYRPSFAAPAAVRPPPRLVEPPRRDNPGGTRPGATPGSWPRPGDQRDARPPQQPGTPGNPDVSRRRPWEARPPQQQQQQQQPATIPPPQQPAKVTPPPQQPPQQPPQRQVLPPQQQPPQRQVLPPQQSPPQQPATIPPPRQVVTPPATLPPPRQQPNPPAIPPAVRGQPPQTPPVANPQQGRGQGGPGGQQGGPQGGQQGGPRGADTKGEKGDPRRRPPQPGEPPQPQPQPR